MATRLYGVATAAAPVSPAFDAGWSSTSGAVRRNLSTAKAASTETRAGVAVTSGSGNETLGFQLVSAPLTAQTISGTVTIMARGRELATSDNINARVRGIRVVSNDGTTVRGTLLALGNHSVTTEPGTTVAGYQFATATALSSVTAQAGDRIVVELGWGMTTTGTSPQYDLVIGGTGTDHVNTAGPDTTGTVPWVEFSANLVFAPAPTYAETGWQQGGGSNAAVAVGPISWQAGDYIVCMGATGDGSKSLGTPAAIGGQSFAAQGSAIGTAGTSAWAHRWVAGPMPSAGEGSTSITPAGTATPNWGAFIESLASSGPGATAAPSPSGTKTASLTRTGTGSTVYGLVADWSAGTISGRAYTPAGATEKSFSDGGGGTYSTFAARWDSQGAAGTTSYGLSAGGGAGPFSIVLLEMTVAAGGSTVSAAADLVAAGLLAAAAARTAVAAAGLGGTGSLSAAGVRAAPAAAGFAGTGALAAAAVRAAPAAAALTGTGSLTAAGTVTGAGAATDLTATGALAAAAARIAVAAAPMSAVGALSAVAALSRSGTAALAGTGALSASAVRATPAGAALAGTAALTAAAVAIRPAAAALLGVGVLTATTGAVPAAGAAAIIAAGTLTGAAARTAAAVAPLMAATAVVAGSTATRPAAAQLLAAGTLTAAGVATQRAAAALVAAGRLDSAATVAGPVVFGRLSAVAGPQNALTAVSGAAPTHTLAAGTLATVSSRAGRAGGPV